MILQYLIYGMKTTLLYSKIYNKKKYSRLFYFYSIYPLWAWYACQITIATASIYAFLLYKWYLLDILYISLLVTISILSILIYFFIAGYWALFPIKLEQEELYIKLALEFSNHNDNTFITNKTYYGLAVLLKRLDSNPESKYPELHKEIKRLTTIQAEYK